MAENVVTQRWDIGAAWEASAAICAATFNVPAVLITAPSRGRGPRPPANIWLAKKMAIHLAVVIADCGYAALGEKIGLHRDTVASHCAEIRAAAMKTERGELISTVLEFLARTRLQSLAEQQLATMRAQLAMLEATVRDFGQTGGDAAPVIGFIQPAASSDIHPTLHPTKNGDHGNVIRLPGTGGAA